MTIARKLRTYTVDDSYTASDFHHSSYFFLYVFFCSRLAYFFNFTFWNAGKRHKAALLGRDTLSSRVAGTNVGRGPMVRRRHVQLFGC